jgi:hypothetical protein
MAAIRSSLFQRRHEPVPVIGAWLHRVLNGYFAYHAVPTNLGRLNSFRSEVCRAWRQALLRRSQRTGSTGRGSIVLPVNTSRHAGFCIPIRRSDSLRHNLRQEPYAVALHVRICAGGGQ